MYRKFFGIAENPFSNTPDPNFLYLTERHREALAHLNYGVEGRSGFVLLTGEVGTGKTTLCRCLIERLPSDVDVALCVNPRLDEIELLAYICDEMGIQLDGSRHSSKDLTDAINKHLLALYAGGRRAVLIIDEAQNLPPQLLEQVRLLTNLETDKSKLLQIILIGQPELKDSLARDDLRQLSQRITARYHLDPLNIRETRTYIAHRLRVVGLADGLFSDAAVNQVYRLSNGVPRLINSICERAMLGAYAQNKRRIDPALVRTAAAETLGGENATEDSPLLLRILLLSLIVMIGALALHLSARTPDATQPAPTSRAQE